MVRWRAKIITRSLAVSLTCSIFLFASAAGAATASARPIPAQQQAECQLQPAGGSSGRVLILVNGIDSSARDITEMAAGWTSITKHVANIYSYFLYFSYSDESATSYVKEDTYKSILFHHVPLLQSIIDTCYAQGHQSFDIIGYSLGGVVAMEYIKSYGFTYSGRVRHVVTLDSPINGVFAFDASFFLSGMVGSVAAQEVTTLAKSENTRYQNIHMAQALGKLGTEVWTLTNEDDHFIWADNAINPVLSKTFKLGNLGPPWNTTTPTGHNQILNFDRFPEVAKAGYGILYHMPNSARVTELKEVPVLKPGEQGNVRIVIQNASIMPWLAGQTTLVNVSGPTFGLAVKQPLPEIPASGQLELAVHVKAPQSPGVYDSTWKIAIGDIPFDEAIPISVVVVPAGSSAGMVEQIQALIAQARGDLSQRFQETWDGLREQILAAIHEEIARQVRAAISQICSVTPTGVVIAGGVVWWRRRKREDII